jgi:hypothetical protein
MQFCRECLQLTPSCEGDGTCIKHGDFCFYHIKLEEYCEECAKEKGICQKCGKELKNENNKIITHW